VLAGERSGTMYELVTVLPCLIQSPLSHFYRLRAE